MSETLNEDPTSKSQGAEGGRPDVPLFGVWIPASQPPDHERIVIVYDSTHPDKITTAEYHSTWADNGQWVQGKYQIEVTPTHWMPCPSKPNAEVSHGASNQ